MLDGVALQTFASIEHRRERQDHRCWRVFGEEAGELVEGAHHKGVGIVGTIDASAAPNTLSLVRVIPGAQSRSATS